MAGQDVDDQTEPRAVREFQSPLAFALGLIERVARREEVGHQAIPEVRRKREIATFVGGRKTPPQQIATGADVPGPGVHAVCEVEIDARPETREPALVRKLECQLADAKPGLVIAEARSQQEAEQGVRVAPAVAVAVNEAQVRDPAHDEADQIDVGEVRSRNELRQHLHGGAAVGIAHERLLSQFGDRTLRQLASKLVVLGGDILFGRMCRPGDPDFAEIVEADLHGAIELIQRRVQDLA